MRRFTVAFVLGFIGPSHAREEAAPQHASDMLAELLGRRLVVSLPHRADVDDTVIGKPGRVAMPRAGYSPTLARPSLSARIPGSVVVAHRPRVPQWPEVFTPQADRMRVASAKALDTLKQFRRAESVVSAAEATPAQEAAETAPAEDLPYDIRFFVDGAQWEESDVNYKYMERKIKAALENQQDDIETVDVRLKVEGQKSPPKRYQMEVTVKMNQGKVIVSNPNLAENTFTEEVDHVHDTLKRSVRQEKEKRISKLRKDRKKAENAANNARPEESSDEISDDYP